MVLGLPALPQINFLPLEIQEDELMSDDSSEEDEAQVEPINEALHQGMVAEGENQEVHQQIVANIAIQEAIQPAQQVNDHPFDHIHIGMVQLVDQFDHDPVLKCFTGFGDNEISWTPKQNADGIRLWAKYFAPAGRSVTFEIPQSWSDFFTVLLLNPARFEWAKTFITSKAWELIVSYCPQKHGRQFALPPQCPTTNAHKCLIEEISAESGDSTHNVVSEW